MDMNKNFPLQSVLDLSQMKLEEATRRLGELVSGEQHASERLGLLTQYRDEYQQRFLEAARDGLGPEQWRNFQQFLGQLDAAIGQARDMLSQSHQLTTTGQREWLDHRGRVKAFDTLASRHRARVAYEESHREQKVTDEQAARLHGKHRKPDE
jgi:flagellar FliJ protein